MKPVMSEKVKQMLKTEAGREELNKMINNYHNRNNKFTNIVTALNNIICERTGIDEVLKEKDIRELI